MNLDQRRNVAAATLDFMAGRPLEIGTSDCGLMIVHHLKAMGWPIRTGGTWKTVGALKRFLRRHGGDGAACIDGWGLARIAPARTIIADIVQLHGEPPFGAFGICFGNGRVLAFHEDAGGYPAIIQPTEVPLAAWRT